MNTTTLPHTAPPPDAVDLKVSIDHDEDVKKEENVALSEIPTTAWSDLTVKEAVMTFRKTTFVCVAALFLACSDGFQFSLPGNLVANTSFVAQFGTIPLASGIALDAQHVAAWNGVYSAGYISALLTGGWPADRYGRKFNMYLLCLFMIAACIIEIFAREWTMWCGAKLLNGLSIGLCQLTLTSYVAEVAPVRIRGSLLVVYSFFWAFGQFTAAIATYILQAGQQETRAYLRVIYSMWVFTGISLVIIFFIPESPRWYLRVGKREQAAKVLQRLNGKIPGYDIERELNFMTYELTGELNMLAESAKVSYFDLFKGSNLRRTLVSFSVLGWQQCLGIAIVYGNSAIFFRAAGLSNPFLGTVIINLLSLVVIFTSSYLVERLGRRPLLLVGGCGMVAALLIIASMGFLSTTGPNGPVVGGVTVAVMCIWVVFYTGSAGPCGYLLLGESPTTGLRAKTAGFAAAMSGVFGLIFSYTTPLMILPTGRGWGIKTAFLFAGTGFIGLVLIYFFVPEHKGRTFAELDEMYEQRIPARKFRTTVTTAEQAKELAKTNAATTA